MKRSAVGFTIIEILIVIAIIGIAAAMAFPKLSGRVTTLNVRSAKQEVAAYLARARAAAIQNGRAAQFVRNGNVIEVQVDSDTGAVLLGAKDLFDAHGVSVSAWANPAVIRFDPRGIADALGGTRAIVLSKAGVSDSVCVLGFGKVSTEGCSL
jgi:prepilin-type N-terminal cleavage/methylation domain-containing protein